MAWGRDTSWSWHLEWGKERPQGQGWAPLYSHPAPQEKATDTMIDWQDDRLYTVERVSEVKS